MWINILAWGGEGGKQKQGTLSISSKVLRSFFLEQLCSSITEKAEKIDTGTFDFTYIFFLTEAWCIRIMWTIFEGLYQF